MKQITLSECLARKRATKPITPKDRLEWLAHKDWDAYLTLQKHIWHARMESVLDQIPFPRELGAQMAYYRANWAFCSHCGHEPLKPQAWLCGDINAAHFMCHGPARVRLRLAKETPAYLHLQPLPSERPTLFGIPADGAKCGFRSCLAVTKAHLMLTLRANGIEFKRSWSKTKLWKALLSHE